jgi:hypothetical protein
MRVLEIGCDQIGILSVGPLNTIGSWLFGIAVGLVVVGVLLSVAMILLVRAFGRTDHTRKGVEAIAVVFGCALLLAVVPPVLSAHATCSVSGSQGGGQPVGLKPQSTLPQLPDDPQLPASESPSASSAVQPSQVAPTQAASATPTQPSISRLSAQSLPASDY